ncbi:MAG: rRNA maturation RNase YbeY [Bdellovibrionota bacterium]
MQIEIINYTKDKIPKKFVQDWTKLVIKNLKSQKILGRKISQLEKDLIVVFVTSAKMKKLNSQFRGKNKHTDILSFEPIEESSLGELVLCLPVLKKQAKEHKLSLNHEIGYMLIHGILHLLGYDHETNEREAKIMFDLQDILFEKLLKS